MRIFRPVKTNRINQVFGQNLACEKPNGTIVNALNGVCPVGTVSLYAKVGMKGHNGYDLGCWYGEPVYHCADFKGWIKTEVDKSGGIGVDVISKEPVYINGKWVHVKMRYWHLKAVYGHDGKEVDAGALMGYGDSTGASSGNHVHLGMKVCDAHGNALEKQNGYFGAMDFTRYWENTFVVDYVDGIKEEALNAIQLAWKIIGQVKMFLKSRK